MYELMDPMMLPPSMIYEQQPAPAVRPPAAPRLAAMPLVESPPLGMFGAMPSPAQQWAAAPAPAAAPQLGAEEWAAQAAAPAMAPIMPQPAMVPQVAMMPDPSMMMAPPMPMAGAAPDYAMAPGVPGYAPAPGVDAAGVPGAAPQQPEKPVDPAAMSAAAAQLRQAMDGIGTDEKAIHDALRGKSPAEIAAIKAAYADHYPGRSLDADLDDELSGDDLALAKAAMSGDQVQSKAAALVNAAGGLGTDEKAIHDTLESIKDPKERAAVAAAYQQRTGKSLDSMLKDELSGNDLALAQALQRGDTNAARAVKLDEAMNGGFLGLGIGTDEDAVYSAIEGCKTPQERAAMAAAYKARTGKDLDASLNDELSGAERDVAGALMNGNAAQAAAARMAVAADGLGTDESAIFKQLEGKSGPERQAIIDAYNAKYGAAGGGKSFDDMLKDELGAMDLERARQLAKNGKLSPEFALQYAMDGVGTDEEMIRSTLAGKSAAEIQQIRAAYKARTGRDLDAELADETSGRDGFEINQMMQGEPRTPEEKLARMNAAYEFERGSGAGVFGNAVMDVFSDNGKSLDLQHQRLEELGERIRNGTATPEDMQRLDTLAGYQKQDVKNYQASRDTVTNGLATGATVAVGAVVTIATAGAAAPAVVAAVGALAGGAAGMAVKAGMQGASYDNESIAADAAQTLISAASAGLLKAEAVQGLMAGLAGVAPGAQATIAQQIAMGAMGGAAGGLINGVSSAAMDERVYRGEGNGALEFLKTAGMATAGGAVSGAASSAAAIGLDKLGLPQVDPTGRPASLLNGAISGAVGGVAQTAVDPGTYTGNWEDIALRFAQSGVSNAVGSAADGYATGVHEQMKAAAARLGIPESEIYASANRAAVAAEAARPTAALPEAPATAPHPAQEAPPVAQPAPMQEPAAKQGLAVASGEQATEAARKLFDMEKALGKEANPSYTPGSTEEAPHQYKAGSPDLNSVEQAMRDFAEGNQNAQNGKCSSTCENWQKRMAEQGLYVPIQNYAEGDHRYMAAGNQIIDPTFGQFFKGDMAALPNGKSQYEPFVGGYPEMKVRVQEAIDAGMMPGVKPGTDAAEVIARNWGIEQGEDGGAQLGEGVKPYGKSPVEAPEPRSPAPAGQPGAPEAAPAAPRPGEPIGYTPSNEPVYHPDDPRYTPPSGRWMDGEGNWRASDGSMLATRDEQVIQTARRGLVSTDEGQQMLQHLNGEGKDTSITVNPNEGTYRQGDKINLDPNMGSDQMSEALVHEGVHLRTYDRDVPAPTDTTREGYVKAALRNEAEAVAAQAEHAQQRGTEPRPEAAQYQQYKEEARQALQTENPGMSDRVLDVLARETATDKMAEQFAGLKPSTSYDENGNLKPGAPANYEDHYGRAYDSVADAMADTQRNPQLPGDGAAAPAPAAERKPGEGVPLPKTTEEQRQAVDADKLARHDELAREWWKRTPAELQELARLRDEMNIPVERESPQHKLDAWDRYCDGKEELPDWNKWSNVYQGNMHNARVGAATEAEYRDLLDGQKRTINVPGFGHRDADVYVENEGQRTVYQIKTGKEDLSTGMSRDQRQAVADYEADPTQGTYRSDFRPGDPVDAGGARGQLPNAEAIARDRRMVGAGMDVVWVLEKGASPQLIKALEEAGIRVVVGTDFKEELRAARAAQDLGDAPAGPSAS